MRTLQWRGAGTIAVIAMLLIVGAVGVGRAAPAPPLADLLASETPGFLDLTLVFRPLDCQLPLEIIEELNELALTEAVVVRGVMLGPVPKGKDLDNLLQGLRITFPVVEDSDGHWSEALMQAAIPNPTLFIYRSGLRHAAITLDGLQTLKRYLPKTARALGVGST